MILVEAVGRLFLLAWLYMWAAAVVCEIGWRR